MDTVIQIVVGTKEEIATGHGETAVVHDEAAKIIGVSPSSFRILMLQGLISPVGRLGKARIFRERDVVALRDQLATRSSGKSAALDESGR